MMAAAASLRARAFEQQLSVFVMANFAVCLTIGGREFPEMKYLKLKSAGDAVGVL